jgi:fucose permease
MLTIAAVIGVLVYGMIAALLGSILPDLSKRFKLGPSQMAQIALGQAVGLVLASIAVGPMLDATGHKVTLCLALALVSVGLFMLTKSAGFTTVALWMFVVGLGGGIIVAGANSLNGNIQTEFGWSGTFTANFLNLFFGLGGLLTPFIMANIFQGNAYRLVYLIAAISGVGVLINGVADLPQAANRGGAFSTAGDLFSSGNFWLIAVLLFCYIAAEVGVWNWLVQHLIAQGVPEKSALNVLSLGFALGLIAGRLATGLLPADLNPALITAGSAALMAIATFGMLQTSGITGAGALVFLAGLAAGPMFPTSIAITQQKFAGDNTALGLALVFGWLGLAVSSPIIGSIAGGDPKKLKTALLLLPVFSVVMVAVSLLLR